MVTTENELADLISRARQRREQCAGGSWRCTATILASWLVCRSTAGCRASCSVGPSARHLYRGGAELCRLSWSQRGRTSQLVAERAVLAGSPTVPASHRPKARLSFRAATQRRDGSVKSHTAASPRHEALHTQSDRGAPEEVVLLADALEHLPPDYREVILLRNLEGLPFDAVAERMDRTIHSVKNLWARALGKLRDSLQADG